MTDREPGAGDLPARSRGVIALLEENCTVCMLCARECPDWCIYIESHKEPVPGPEYGSGPVPGMPPGGAPGPGGGPESAHSLAGGAPGPGGGPGSAHSLAGGAPGPGGGPGSAHSPAGRAWQRVRNVLDRFAIDFSLCMYCGICVEVCPYDALFWSPEFDYAETGIAALTHERDRLREAMWTVPPPPAHDPGAPQPREVITAVPDARGL